MNKLLRVASIAAVAVFASGSAHADSTGCGLGTMLFNGNRGVVPSVLAVTTNGTSGNQTFGISSGTLGCDQNNKINGNGRLFSFANENLNELAADTSKGGGEYLTVAASIIGIKENDQSRFYSVMQQNFSTIFSDQNANTTSVVLSIREVMKNDQVLKTYNI